MPRTLDRQPGESDEEGLLFENRPLGDDPVTAGGVRYVNGGFSFRDSLGLFNPRTGGGGSSLFGQWYTWGVSEAQSDTTNTAFQNKLTINTPAVDAGTYLFLWSAEVRVSTANRQLSVRVTYDTVNTVSLCDAFPSQANVWVPISGMSPNIPLAAAAHTVQLDWRSAAVSHTASIRRARVVLWRVL